MKEHGLSTLSSIILLVSISIVFSIILYVVWSKTFTHTMSSTSRENTLSQVIVYSIRTGPGYIAVWASAQSPTKVTGFLLFSPRGRLVCTGKLPYPQIIRRNLTLLRIPMLLVDCSSDPGKYPYLVLGLVTRSSTTIVGDVYKVHYLSSVPTFGYLIDSNTTGKSQISTGPLSDAVTNLEVSLKDPLVYFVLLFNRTILWCYNNTGAESACGKSLAVVFTNTSVINMEDPVMKRSLVSRDSPVLIIINPTYGTRLWTVTVVDTQGYVHRLYLDKVADKRDEVVLDYIIMIEDMWPWSPTDMTMWLNYWDTVLRVTIFVNGTVRVRDFADTGAYYHAVFLNVRPGYLKMLPYEAVLFYRYVVRYLGGSAPPVYYSPTGLTFVKPFYFADSVILAKTLTVEGTPTDPVYIHPS